MSTSPRHTLAELLGQHAAMGAVTATVGTGAASALVRTDVPDLCLDVAGIGPIDFPVSAEQAAALAALGQPARYGRGEQTLTDPSVRDTWEIPQDAVHVDWGDALGEVLQDARDALGLAPDRRLTASFHSMLVYGPGQFFVPHQDSEKDDAMVATLVVMLPSVYSGGDLVVHHQGVSQAYLGSRATVRLVAFYSDCRHEVRPVKSGHRITLTYNLLLHGPSPTPAEAGDGVVSAAARHLIDHFTQPRARQYRPGEDPPARRLVYLLDHEYTARGLDWSRLKGADAGRAALLRAAAREADCDAVLALADLRETWDAQEPDPGYRRRRWHDEKPRNAGEYEVTDLLDSSVTLTFWLDPTGAGAEDVQLSIDDTELCATTSNDGLEPYSSEYEGYMGNYGNTLDRWYRRAAVVVWPRDLRFAVRGQASPSWVLGQLAAMARAGEVKQARAVAATLEPSWDQVVRARQPGMERSRLFDAALLVAADLDDAPLAQMLLAPFALEELTPIRAAPLAALTERYGGPWAGGLLRGWGGTPTWARPLGRPDRRTWLATLPPLCEALQAEGTAGTAAAHLLLGLAWRETVSSIGPHLASRKPSSRQQLAALAPSVAALLDAVAVAGESRLRDTVAAYCQAQDDATALLLPVLRTLAGLPADRRAGAGAGPLAQVAAAQLLARLARPMRAAGDWSLELPTGCTCELCTTLATFLRDPARQSFDWPLAEPRRQHVHARIEQAELPVQHVTRRTGRPYTLVLTKARDLFDRERKELTRDQANVQWLEQELGHQT